MVAAWRRNQTILDIARATPCRTEIGGGYRRKSPACSVTSGSSTIRVSAPVVRSVVFASTIVAPFCWQKRSYHRPAGKVGGVDPGAAVQDVVAGLTVQDVVAVAAVEPVLAVAAADEVAATLAVKRVVAPIAAHLVAAAPAAEDVARVVAHEAVRDAEPITPRC